MFGDGLLMEKILGVLNIFVPTLQIPTYYRSRGSATTLLPAPPPKKKNSVDSASRAVDSRTGHTTHYLVWTHHLPAVILGFFGGKKKV